MTTNPVIPDAAVEAAIESYYEEAPFDHQRALAAAYPHIRAAVLAEAARKIESDADFIAACDDLIHSLLGWWLDRKGGKETMPNHMSEAWTAYQEVYRAWRAASHRYVSTAEPEITAALLDAAKEADDAAE